MSGYRRVPDPPARMMPFIALLPSEKKAFVAVGDEPPRIPVADNGGRGRIKLLDRLHVHRVSTVDKSSQVSGSLTPIQSRILGDLAVETHV